MLYEKSSLAKINYLRINKKTTIFKGITAEQLRETEEEDVFVENKVIAAVMEVRLGL